MASALEHPLRDGSGRDSHGVQVVRQVCPALLVHRDEIRHPDPERAASLAIFFAASIARERLLFADAPHSNSAGLADPELEQELLRLIRGYLKTPDPTPRNDR